MGATARNVDFTNVKESSGINKKRVPAGDYAAIIWKVEDAPVKSPEKGGDGIPMYLFYIKLKDRPTSVFPYYTKLQENQYWKLRNILIAAGKTVPKKRARVDPNTIVGKLIGVTLEDSEYEKDGTVTEQSEIAAVFPAADLGDNTVVDSGDDDEDEPDVDEDDTDLDDLDNSQPAADDEAEPDEEPEPEEEEAEPDVPDYSDLDRATLKARIKELQPDFVVYKSTTDDQLRETLTQLTSTTPASTETEEEDEEPEPAPKPAAKRKPKPKTEDISDDDIDDIDIDDL